MDTTIISTRILQDYGYNPSTMARFALKGWDGGSHMWLAVSDGKGRFAFIETCAFDSGRSRLGEVVSAEQSANYASGYVLSNPMSVIQCFGYRDERFLTNLGKVKKTVSGSIVLRRDPVGESRWLYHLYRSS